MRFVLALATVVLLAVGAEAEPNSRALYHHWIDADHDCQDTRTEVLIVESVVKVTLDARSCRVLRGRWLDPYTGRTLTNPGQLDVDHLVPLGEVHISGGDRWSSVARPTPTTSLIRTL